MYTIHRLHSSLNILSGTKDNIENETPLTFIDITPRVQHVDTCYRWQGNRQLTCHMRMAMITIGIRCGHDEGHRQRER
jgi:hypothetical protein